MRSLPPEASGLPAPGMTPGRNGKAVAVKAVATTAVSAVQIVMAGTRRTSAEQMMSVTVKGIVAGTTAAEEKAPRCFLDQ